jgi:hypothetical protein
MINSQIDAKKLRHDLKGLIGPLEMAKQLFESQNLEKGSKLQLLVIEELKKLVASTEEVKGSLVEEQQNVSSNPSPVIVIDDQEVQREKWKLGASTYGLAPYTFESVEEFLLIGSTLDKNIPIFLDSDLGSALRGEEQIEIIRDLGFKTIYISTSLKPEDIQVNGATKVIGKNFDEVIPLIDKLNGGNRNEQPR